MSDNKLSDAVGPALTKLLTEHVLFEELYFCWNNLTSVGAEPLFKSLLRNESLRVLDLGWNGLGSNMKVVKKNAASFVETVGQFLQVNKSMLHLSLNNNGFSFEESQKIAEVINRQRGSKIEQNSVRFPFLWKLRLHRLPRIFAIRHQPTRTAEQTFASALERTRETRFQLRHRSFRVQDSPHRLLLDLPRLD